MKHVSSLTIRMVIVTRLVRVVTYGKELPPINLHNTSMEWYFEVMWQKKNTYLHLQKIYEHKTRQGADIVKEAPKLKSTRPFDEVTTVRLRNFFKNIHLYFQKVYS